MDDKVTSECQALDAVPVSKNMKKKRLVQRSEASKNASEFNLTEVGKEKVQLNELIASSQKLTGQTSMKKQLQNAKKLKSLSVPLSKPQLQKIKRTVAYEKVCDEVSKWDSVVKSNRVADQIIYPLKKPEFRLESFKKVSESFVTKHPVEVAVSELLKQSENQLAEESPLTVAEEKALKAMSPEEAKLRHNELMRHRALISYKEAKARRQNKIKSKRYHRLLKKEKLKNVMKEFETLKEVDKEAALEKLEEADKLRVLERMTLKHRNTGKWAKQQKLRAKYNPESRSVLKQDLVIGRQLKEKVMIDEETVQKLRAQSSLRFREPELEMSTNGLIEEPNQINNGVDALTTGEIDGEETHLIMIDSLPVEGKNSLELGMTTGRRMEKSDNKGNESSKNKTKDFAAVNDILHFADAQELDSLVPDGITFGDDELDDAHEGIMNISEAFADEELIAEFREDKKLANKANRIEGIDLFLPGWGTWGGPSIKQSSRKRKRFFIKPPEAPKKNTLGNVILNEDKDKKAAAHQVSDLPFPFSNIHQFESYIRQPIGHTWNPQSSFQNLIRPKVVTKRGKIIEPIDPEDVVLEKKPKEAPRIKSRKTKKKISFQKPF